MPSAERLISTSKGTAMFHGLLYWCCSSGRIFNLRFLMSYTPARITDWKVELSFLTRNWFLKIPKKVTKLLLLEALSTSSIVNTTGLSLNLHTLLRIREKITVSTGRISSSMEFSNNERDLSESPATDSFSTASFINHNTAAQNFSSVLNRFWPIFSKESENTV